MKHKSLRSLGFIRMVVESSIYYTPATSDLGLTIIGTVVDDFLIIAWDREVMAEVKRRLATVWKIVDKGPAKWMINLRVRRDRPAGILKLDQSVYIESKMRQFGIDHLPPVELPMKPHTRLSSKMCPVDEDDIVAAENLPYRSHTGALNYLRVTRADMCCVNSILSQFNKRWGQAHFDETTHAWQYAAATKHWGLIFRKSGWTYDKKVKVSVWVDEGFVSCPDTRRSRCGFFVFLNGDVIDFGCKLQPGVPAQSTAATEYRAVTDVCNAVIWIRACLKELGIEIQEPVLFHEDNETCINMSTNYMTTKRTKHIDVKHHVIRYWCDNDVIDFAYNTMYCVTDGQLADIMTKVLTSPCFKRLRCRCMSTV